jgi:surface antigen
LEQPAAPDVTIATESVERRFPALIRSVQVQPLNQMLGALMEQRTTPREKNMTVKTILMAAAAVLTIGTSLASAQPMPPPPGNDPFGYYSQNDQNGYYDRDGHYQRIRGGRRDDYGPPPPPGPPQGAYYQQGRYEQDCHRGNQAAGTIFGALAGGLIGGAASRGNGGAVVGGAILGGLLGNAVSRDIECDDQPYAFRVYADGLNGDLGRRYEWHHGPSYGYFTPVREFHRGGVVCRDFTETSYRQDGHTFTRSGSACRRADGNWTFD